MNIKKYYLRITTGVNMNFHEYRKGEVANNLSVSGLTPFDVMVVGPTGVGKSSTMNSFFNYEIAKVGYGVDPETVSIKPYRLSDDLRIWDTPGFGDGVLADKHYKKAIKRLLKQNVEVDGKVYGLIDIVLVILDSSSRDLSTAYEIISKVLKHIEPERVFVIINQADFSMKGRNWNKITNQPNEILLSHLEEQAKSVKQRIYESTGLNINNPVFYSAKNNYNITAVFDLIVDHMPKSHRLRAM